jgi:dATP pyrophosphohydrolase
MATYRWKRPESVLVVVASQAGEVLLLERCAPRGFWQSVTGSLDWGESAAAAASRELLEETGLSEQPEDCREMHRFPIVPPWRSRYAPEATHNLEHVFRLVLPARIEVGLNPSEHVAACWLPRAVAARRVGSWSNREAILRWVPDAGA